MHSIRTKLIFGLSLLIVPLVGLLIASNRYSISVVRDLAVAYSKQIIEYHMGRIDADLADTAEYLRALHGSEGNLITMGSTRDEDTFQLAKLALSNRLNRDVILYRSIDSVFVFTVERHDYFEVNRIQIPFDERQDLRMVITDELLSSGTETGLRSGRWRIRELGEASYLEYAVFANGVWIGSWVKMDRLIDPLRELDLGEGGIVSFIDARGDMLTSTRQTPPEYVGARQQRRLLIGIPSQTADFSLSASIADKEVLRNLPWFQSIIWIATLCAAATIPLFILVLQRTVLKPLRGLVVATHRIREGEMDHRVEILRSSDEFESLVRSFNAMIERIRMLKIDIYEEQIERQQTEYERLRLQIKPHFFLNSLNTIYHLAQLKRNEDIQNLISDLVRYFRFILQENRDFVTIGEELDLIRAYLGIQDARSPGSLLSEFDIDQSLLSASLPALVVQGLVENSVKYASSLDERVVLRISVSSTTLPCGENGIMIKVDDDGPGYPDDFLEEFDSGKPISAPNGGRVGIRNIRNRLTYLYGDRASLSCRNVEKGGAVAILTLPHSPDSPQKTTKHSRDTNPDKRPTNRADKIAEGDTI